MKLLSALITFCLPVMLHSQHNALSSLVEAERSFAAMSQKEGIKNAFVSNLADDALIFRPGPINGMEYWKKKQPSTATLEWHPTYADIAASGDLGYTMGPSVFTPSPDLDQPPHYGYFFSIWKRSADQKWKVALDAGISTPAPTSRDTSITFASTTIVQSSNKASTPPVMLQLERGFGALAEKQGMATAYARYLATDARMMREGHFPFLGSKAIIAHLKTTESALTWNPITSRVASSMDFAYTYGKYALKMQASEETGHFVRIWKRQPNGAWKVVFDTFQPIPFEK